MAATVRLEDESFRDPRIKRLARKLGTSYFDALGRMAFVWHYCTDKQVYAVGDGTLADLTDREDFAELMISADLGEREGTLVRVKGTEGRIEWLGERRAAAAKGGEANRKRIAAKKGAKGEPNGSQVASQTVQKGSQTVQKGSPPSPSPSPSPNTSLPAVAGGAQGALPHVGAPPAKPPALTKAEVYSALERASRGRFAVGDGQPTDKIAIAINKHIGIMAERGVTLADVRLAGEYIAAWNYEVQLGPEWIPNSRGLLATIANAKTWAKRGKPPFGPQRDARASPAAPRLKTFDEVRAERLGEDQ